MKTKYIQIHCLRCLKNSILRLTPATSAKDSRHPHEEIGRFLWKHSEKVGCWQYPPHRGDGSKNVGNYMWEECMCRLGPKKISKRKYLHDSVEMWEKCTPLWREAHFQIKMFKNTFKKTPLRTTFGSWMWQKWTPLRHKAHFEVKSVKNLLSRTTFWRSTILFRGKRYGFCTLPKVSKTWGFSQQNVLDRWIR